MRKTGFIILACLTAIIITPSAALAGPKIYWHFTFKAFVDLPDTSAYEWAWVTMVEIDRAAVFPEQARAARQQGGRFDGIFFAQVRAAAWRTSHRYFRKTKCHGRPAQHEVWWEESESESVFCGGMLYPSQPFHGKPGEQPAVLDQFRLGFTNRKVLRENGRYEDLSGRALVSLGGIHVVGGSSEETKGRFYLQVVNYRDNVEHHRRCEDAWVEQHNTVFAHLSHDHLYDDIPPVGGSIFSQRAFGPHNKVNIVWAVERTRDREHPHWKEQTM
jgi:hypothetical protein